MPEGQPTCVPSPGTFPWHTVTALVEEIYTGRWYGSATAMAVHAETFRASTAALLRIAPDTQQVEVLACHGLDEDAGTVWARVLQRRGLLRRRPRQLVSATHWGGATPTAPAPVDAASTGSGTHTLTAGLEGSDGVTWALWFERELGREAFGHQDAELLRQLIPHWHRVLSLQGAVDELNARLDAATEIMDHSPTGIITLNSLGRILFTNAEARRIAQEADGVLLNDGRVHVDDPRCRKLYEAAIARLLVPSHGAALPFCLLHVPRLSGQPPYQLCIVSRKTGESGLAGRRPALFVYLRDLRPARVPHPLQLHALYGLTAAEANLCQLLYQGTPLHDAARSLGITLNTAKTQRRHAYRKIGVNSQAQLIQRLIMQYWGPLDRPGATPGDIHY